MNWIDLLQWPALIVTVAAAWLVSVNAQSKREFGFWIFLLSNVLWVIWGWSAHAYALVALQCCLAVSNVHGVLKNRKEIVDKK